MDHKAVGEAQDHQEQEDQVDMKQKAPSLSTGRVAQDIQSDADQPCPDPRCNDHLGAIPIPQCVTAVAWAERAQEVEGVLRQMSDRFNGIDSGYCRLCTGGFRLYDTKGNPQACDNKGCLSHRIAAVLVGGSLQPLVS